jgi:NDP-sugar pyrophosphorylase family protein
MREVLLSLAPGATIISIDEHDKGPVHATIFAQPYIHDDEEVLVSYCDYTMEFDMNEMIQKVKEGGFAGAVPSYTGFHPHLLHKKLYGGVLSDSEGVMLDYKEKHSFTEDPMESYHSAGAYYFRNGKEFKQYADELMNSDISLNGEKYTSMVYYLYLRDGKKIYVPEVKKFMQWGTPEDLEEFESWSRYFAKKLGHKKGETSIPKERELLVTIPYQEGTSDFIQSHDYWEGYYQ